MKAGVPVLIALAALVTGSALVRSRAREAARSASRETADSAAEPMKPLPVPTSPTGEQAVRLVDLHREQRRIRTTVPVSGFSEEQVRRLRAADKSLDDGGRALSASLRGDLEAWKDLITLLSALDEFESGRDLLLRVRGSIDSRSEPLWIEMLRSGSRADDRRLALVALSGRSSRELIVALSGRAREDVDRRVRSESLMALVERRRRPLPDDLARLVSETLTSRSSAEQDPAVRALAAGYVTQMRQELAPVPPSPRRTMFGQGPKPAPNQNP